MNFPKLPRMPMRSESEPGYEKEAWRPTWQCFCCYDTGFVVSHLAAMVIEGFNLNKDKLPICQNPNCDVRLGQTLLNSNCLDWRLDQAICLELDRQERDVWDSWRQEQYELRQKALGIVEGFAKSHSLRCRGRTPTEEMEARQKHSCVLAESNGQMSEVLAE